MAETTLQGIWTQKGLDKETAFRAGGERKKLTHVAVGDGNGSLPIVRAAQRLWSMKFGAGSPTRSW